MAPQECRRSAMNRLNSASYEAPEFEVQLEEFEELGNVANPIPVWRRVIEHEIFRRGAVLVLLAALWQVVAQLSANPLMLPSFTDTIVAWWAVIISGELL